MPTDRYGRRIPAAVRAHPGGAIVHAAFAAGCLAGIAVIVGLSSVTWGGPAVWTWPNPAVAAVGVAVPGALALLAGERLLRGLIARGWLVNPFTVISGWF